MSQILTSDNLHQAVTATKRRINQLKAQVAVLNDRLHYETKDLAELLKLLEADPAAISKKTDKRTLWNPIKNLNIGVVRSYEWQKRRGYTAKEARKRVYDSIVKTAIRKNVDTDQSTPESRQYVTSRSDLPQRVILKIEQQYSVYDAAP
jgi:hypothetical protein